MPLHFVVWSLFETQFIFIFAHLHLQTHTHRLTLIYFSFWKTYNFCDVLYPFSYFQLLRICKCKEAREVLLSVFFVGSLNFKPFEKKLFSFFRVTNKVYTAFQNLTSFNIYLLQYGLFARYAMHVPCSNNGLCAWIVRRGDMSLQNGIYAIKRLVS